jgi:site-specific recombinase XerD
MKVSATLKGAKDSLGRRTIYIRIAEGSVRSFRATKMKVQPNQFKKGKVVDHVQASLFNANIKKLILETEVAQMEGKLNRFPDADFFSYYNKCVHEWEKTGVLKHSSVVQYRLELNKVAGFRSSFKLSQIDHSFLKAYKNYCYGLGNVGNTVWKSFKILRRVILHAYNVDRLIEYNPLQGFDFPKYKDPKKVFLTQEQVNLIEEISATLSPSLQYTATWFLIGCYTGLSFADMANFDKKKNVKSGRLLIDRVKTGGVISMPIMDKVRGLLEKINYEPYKYSDQLFRRNLNTLREKCEIDEHFSIHTARHTFATLAASAGISIEVTAKLLGHASTKTTQIYYKIVNKRVDSEYDKMFQKH